MDTAFETFLLGKLIHAPSFRAKWEAMYQRLEEEYAKSGDASMDHAKKFLWNDLRRAFPIPVAPEQKD